MIDTRLAEPDRVTNDEQTAKGTIDESPGPTPSAAPAIKVIWLEAGAVILICSPLAMFIAFPSKD